jgi:CheY-like chemotaxis protein
VHAWEAKPTVTAADDSAFPLGAEQRLAGHRILLVEDGKDNQRLISLHLSREGATVRVVEDGKAAVDAMLLPGASFDLVLMDMQMPVLDGYAATRRLRAAGHRGPIVALTAHASSSDRQRCLDAGCDDYATKPIDREALIATCRSAITSARRAA